MALYKFDEGCEELCVGATLKKLFLDSETFSATPIRDGTYAYAADAEVMLLAYAYENDPFKVVDLTAGEKIPQYVLDDLTDPDYLKVIQNSMFDRTVLRHGLGIVIPPEQIFDTMVCALAHSLPGALKMLCEVLQVDDDDVKDERGKELIQLFCKPRPKNQKVRRFTRETHPQEWQEFKNYAGSDIKAMRAVFNKIPTWNYRGRELDLWRLDCSINDRGFLVDRDLAVSAIEAVAQAQAGLADDVELRTFGEVGKATQRDRLLKFILEYYEVDLPDMTKSTLERRLNDPDLPRAVKELIAIRLEASMASTSKYKALLKSVSDDNRLRGTLQFCGASRTGRWCLAEGTQVLVKDDKSRVYEKPIEKVTLDDLVWDGDQWVTHEGVVFSGYKPIIEHDGVVATAEHIVYLSGTESVTLGEAKEKGLQLWRGNKISL